MAAPLHSGRPEASPKRPRDRLNRPLRDLRISVTDRCNFRCVYCMPRKQFQHHNYLPHSEILTFEETDLLARAFASLGVVKLRLTGGEPLLRTDIEQLIERLAAIDDIEDLSLTTNASLITAERARSLRDAGLARVNLSLDAINQGVFARVADTAIPVSRVLEGIEHCFAHFSDVKVNMVVRRGLNDSEILPMARHFHGSGAVLRFIEFMDVGNTNGWRHEQVVDGDEILRLIQEEMPLEPLNPNYRGEVANRYRYLDGGGEIGVIRSISQPFCGDCHRARLSAAGSFYSCLFACKGTDLKALVRERPQPSVEQLASRIAALWQQRQDRYSEIRFRTPAPLIPRVEMSHIGG